MQKLAGELAMAFNSFATSLTSVSDQVSILNILFPGGSCALALRDSPLGREKREILLWMARVDTSFEAGNTVLAEDLDAALEVRLDDLEHRLSDRDEGGDVLDGDNHVGIEAQFIDFWSSYLLGVGSFTPAMPASELAEHLRSILRDEALTGPYAPKSFLDQADDAYLLELAADLWNERQAYILGTR